MHDFLLTLNIIICLNTTSMSHGFNVWETLNLSFKVTKDLIHAFLLVFNKNMWHNSTPLR